MRLDKLTSKFQEALGEAQSLALASDHQYIESEHLLLAMLQQSESSAKSLINVNDTSPVVKSLCISLII